jgi:hypothetical protein
MTGKILKAFDDGFSACLSNPALRVTALVPLAKNVSLILTMEIPIEGKSNHACLLTKGTRQAPHVYSGN